MAVVKELIRTEENGTISFGDYEKNQKSKVSDYPHQGDMYKVKTFKEITKLERNGMFVYESVPGTAVFNLAQDGNQMSFRVEGPEDAQITVELEAEAQELKQEETRAEETQALTEYRSYIVEQSKNVLSVSSLIFITLAFLSGLILARIVWRKL